MTNLSPAVRTVYTTVVLLKLYVAATTPGEMMNIIKKDELRVESYLNRLQKHFQAIMDRDSQIPHAKFLFVIQRLNERYMTILRDVEKRGNGDPEQQPRNPPPPKMLRTDVPAPHQGLRLLSEVAMGGAPPMPHSAPASAASQQMRGLPPGHGPPHPHHQPTHPAQQQNGQWYPPQTPHPMAQVPIGMPIDPMAYGQYNGQFAGFGEFARSSLVALTAR